MDKIYRKKEMLTAAINYAKSYQLGLTQMGQSWYKKFFVSNGLRDLFCYKTHFVEGAFRDSLKTV